MDAPIHVDLLDHSDVKQFAKAAKKVCAVFEHVDDLSEVEFLLELKEKLSLAYALAHRLPNPYNWEDDDDEEVEGSVESRLQPQGMSQAENMEQWKDLYRRIGQKLGPHSHITYVFDPSNPYEREVVDGELAHHFAALYVDLRDSLELYGRSSSEERAQAIWDWRFGMTQGWGSHFAQAFLPMHSLLQYHYDSIGGEWWANYKDEEVTS